MYAKSDGEISCGETCVMMMNKILIGIVVIVEVVVIIWVSFNERNFWSLFSLFRDAWLCLELGDLGSQMMMILKIIVTRFRSLRL